MSHNSSLHFYYYLLMFFREKIIIVIASAHAKNNSLLSLLFNPTLDAAPKNPAHSIYLTSFESIFKESFRSLPFTPFSKVQTQLLSCIEFDFTPLSTIKFYPVLYPSSVMERFLTSFCAKVINDLMLRIFY